MDRRTALRMLLALGLAPHKPLARAASAKPQVVVIGGGYGGTIAAKYLRRWSNGDVAVTLIERNARLVSCPMSNLVLTGTNTLADISRDYDQLTRRWGVQLVTGEVVGIDTARRTVRLRDGGTMRYDRLVVSPGIDFLYDLVPGLSPDSLTVPHAWKAGAQTSLLARQITAMPDGGTFVIHIPPSPYRCPPGPYERACLVADYFRTRKPRAKVIVLDANREIQSKRALFEHAFGNEYAAHLEYRPDSRLLRVHERKHELELEFERIRGDVINVIPPMRAGRVIDQLDVGLVNGRWVDIDWLSMEAIDVSNTHVIGDSILSGSGMPKSGQLANQQGKLVAAAIIDLFNDRPPSSQSVLINTCYSFLDENRAAHVSAAYRYSRESGNFHGVPGAGGLSVSPTALEAAHARAWAQNIWSDMLD